MDAAGQVFLGRIGANFQGDHQAQAAEGAGLVFVLRAAFFGDGEETAGLVAEADGRAGFVSLLTAGAAGAIGIHLTLAKQGGVIEGEPCVARRLGRGAIHVL